MKSLSSIDCRITSFDEVSRESVSTVFMIEDAALWRLATKLTHSHELKCIPREPQPLVELCTCRRSGSPAYEVQCSTRNCDGTCINCKIESDKFEDHVTSS